MKTTIKRENDEFLVITLKHVSGLTSHANRLGTPKLWAIAHENGHKTRKLRVFGPNSQTCIGSLKPCNRPETPQTVAIAHENGYKTRKRCLFSHNSQTCIGSYGRCKSPYNAKTVGNS